MKWCLEKICVKCGHKETYESGGNHPRIDNHRKARQAGWTDKGLCPHCAEQEKIDEAG